MHYILYNSKSNNQNNEDLINNIVEKLWGNVRKISIFDIPSYPEFFNKLVETDDVTIIGGDGTLNHFVNDIKDYDLKVKVYYGAGGTGNDFKNDMIDKVDLPPLRDEINCFKAACYYMGYAAEEYRHLR